MLVPLVFNVISFKFYIAIVVLAFIGTVVDSILGALIQALYKCNTCGKLIENPNSCCGDATLVKGCSLIDNTMVNYLASFITCLLGLILLVL